MGCGGSKPTPASKKISDDLSDNRTTITHINNNVPSKVGHNEGYMIGVSDSVCIFVYIKLYSRMLYKTTFLYLGASTLSHYRLESINQMIKSDAYCSVLLINEHYSTR